MRYRIGIYDEDVTYCTRLMEYINMNKEYMLHSVCFSDAETLLECVNKNQLDLVLYGKGESLMGIIREQCQTMRLADADEERFVGERYLYKYQRVDILVKQILSCLEVEIDKPISGVAFYGVYSPIGRCGKTSLALGICCNYPGSLYIGMNSYIGSTDVNDSVFEQTEHFFYQLLTHNESIVTTIQQAIDAQGGAYAVFYGMRCFVDYKQLTRADLVWLRDILSSGEIVTRLVFDVGTAVLTDLNVLSAMDRIFVPCICDAYANRRMQHFRVVLEGDAYVKLRDRLEYVEVPMEPYDSSGMREYVRRNVK